MHGESPSPEAQKRLETLCKLSDGAEVAAADLELRGAGDLGGERQSGMGEELSYLDPMQPPAWIERIDADARALFERDPGLAAHPELARAVRRAARDMVAREEAG